MAGTFSNKKVARAARTGGGRRRNINSSYGWYSVLAIIMVLGVALVVFSRHERLDATNPGNTPPLAPVADPDNPSVPKRAGDQWFEAFGVYICDKYAPNINVSADPYGISTQNDGVIHITPFEKKYAGRNATLGLFGKAVDLKFARDSVQLPGDQKVYKNGEKCGDKEGELIVKEWSDARDDTTGKQVKAADPKALLLKNNAAVVLAFVPKGTELKNIPLPPSASTLAAVAAGTGAATVEPETPATTAPPATPTTEAGK